MQFMNEAFNTYNRMMALAVTSAEVMLTSGSVVTSRSELISKNMVNLGEVEDEMLRMSQEKVDAAMQSSTAIIDGSFLFVQKLMETSMQCFLNTGHGLVFSPVMPNNGNTQHQMTQWDSLLNGHFLETLNVANHALSVMEEGIKPIHTCVVDNAKRLKA